MAMTRQTGQLLMALAVGLGCLNGCSHTPTATNQGHDPILGVYNPPSMPQPNSAPKTSAPTTALPPNPGFQQPGGELMSTNNATLAGMSGNSLGRPLALDGRAQPTGQLTSGSWAKPEQPANPGYNPNPRVEKVPDIEPTTAKSAPPSWQGAAAAAPPPPAPVAVTPTEALTQQLKERGVINQKVEALPNGVHLICYATRSNGAPRILEATATDFAEAAQAILHQLDNTR